MVRRMPYSGASERCFPQVGPVSLTNIRLDWKGLQGIKHSSLLRTLINYDGKMFYNIGTWCFLFECWASGWAKLSTDEQSNKIWTNRNVNRLRELLLKPFLNIIIVAVFYFLSFQMFQSKIKRLKWVDFNLKSLFFCFECKRFQFILVFHHWRRGWIS
jgi:hypothetical protein